ncbi:MAG: hypothetical protein JWR77_1609 [Rhizorhabdus sp.]|nr:hypothetical protein [Rhizorhabdus sp.]
MQPNAPARPLLRPAYGMPPRASAEIAHSCDNGWHVPLASTREVINDIVHADCRYCGCRLMRMAASRRWFRCGVMGG